MTYVVLVLLSRWDTEAQRCEAERRHCLASVMSLHHIQVPPGKRGEARECKKGKPAFINIPAQILPVSGSLS